MTAIWDDSTSMSGLLNVPHATLTVTRCRMPGTDRCRTKGAVVYGYVPSLLPSLHPPLPCLPLRETGPFLLQSSRRCVADRKVMAQEKGGWVWFLENEGCGGSEPNKLCCATCALSLLFFFSPSTRWCVGCFHLLT